MTALSTSTAPLSALCRALNVPRATVYRRRGPKPTPAAKPTPKRALSGSERQAVLSELHSERFVDRSPAEVVNTLLSEGVYLASERTMYRILDDNDEVKERRNQRVHPEYKRPELMATGPNQVWSWDITRLLTFVKWQYVYLYVVMDIFSRAVVGWLVADTETAALAKRLIDETVAKHDVKPGTLVLHADRGSQMTSKLLAQLLVDLNIERSHSRPQVSNDNPFSESQFRTMKYHPLFPGKFGNVDDAVSFAREFFPWYNDEHHHSGIAYLTPGEVHAGRADESLAKRHAVKTAAWAAHPERFPNGPPHRETLAPAVYINPPATKGSAAAQSDDLVSPPSPSSSPSKTERSEVRATTTGTVVRPPDPDSEPSCSKAGGA